MIENQFTKWEILYIYKFSFTPKKLRILCSKQDIEIWLLKNVSYEKHRLIQIFRNLFEVIFKLCYSVI